MSSHDRITLIREHLEQALQPDFLAIVDDSHQHKGHAGAATGLGHFKIEIQSHRFDTCSKVQAHRLVYEALSSLMQTDIHALSITIKR